MRENNNVIKNFFLDFMSESFDISSISARRIFIYGVELQICGGLLKYLEPGTFVEAIMMPDLKMIGRIYNGRKVILPEMAMPFDEDTIVLVSLLYEYEYEEAVEYLKTFGLNPKNILHAKGLSEQLLDLSAEYFAAQQMDLRVADLFKTINKNLSDVSYLDVGVCNWLFYNNTYLFYKNGAKGVLIEPNPDMYDLISKNRPRDVFYRGGASPARTDDTISYYRTNRAGYNTFVYEIFKSRISKGNGVVELDVTKIPLFCINDIIKDNFHGSHIDYISVDIEGMGASVLNAIDFSEVTIDVILIEMDPVKKESKELYLKLSGLGYIMVYDGIGKNKDFLFYKKDVFL